MKTYGWRAEQREYEQSYYGGYCNKVREQGLVPLPYFVFQEVLREISKLDLTKKERMKRLIAETFKKNFNTRNEVCSCEKIDFFNIREIVVGEYCYEVCNKCNGHINGVITE